MNSIKEVAFIYTIQETATMCDQRYSEKVLVCNTEYLFLTSFMVATDYNLKKSLASHSGNTHKGCWVSLARLHT